MSQKSNISSNIANPDKSCSQAPFWFWNGALDPEQMRQQIRIMAEQHVTGMMPHPRFGMDRRYYLEEPYWKAMDATIDEAEKRNCQIYLYDEYNWPSGAAAGRVTDGRPDLYPNGLDYTVRSVEGPGTFAFADFVPGHPGSGRFDSVINAYIVPGNMPQTLTEIPAREQKENSKTAIIQWGQISADKQKITGHLPKGKHRILIFIRCYGATSSQLDPGSNAFIDYMNPEAVERFISLTHDQYFKRYQRYFGNLIPAIFTDEPSTISGGPFPWTADFAEEFQKRNGYNLLDKLPALCDDFYPGGYEIRADYWKTVADLFEERFIARIAQWCQKAGIALTGHIFDENINAWPAATHLMNWLRHFDWPGIDALGTHAQVASCKIAASVAHLEDKKHFVCEALGLADGWNATLAMAKRGYQILAAMGVDLFIPHAFHQTTENPQMECPPSFFYQNPYWPYYHQLADLTSRLCAFNRHGKHVAPVALYYPIESLWADGTGGRGQGGPPWQVVSNGNIYAKTTMDSFNKCINQLAGSPFDCDVVDSRAIKEGNIDADTARINIGPESFSCIVIPDIRTINSEVIAPLQQFAEAGGVLLFIGNIPERCYPASADISVDSLKQSLKQYPDTVKLVDSDKQFAAILHESVQPVAAFANGKRPDSLYLIARKSESCMQWLFVNDEREECSFSVELPKNMLENLDLNKCIVKHISPETGQISNCQAKFTEQGIQLDLLLGHTESSIIIVEEKTGIRIESNSGNHENPPSATIQLADWQFKVLPIEATGIDALKLGKTICELPVWRMHHLDLSVAKSWQDPGFDDSRWQQVATLRDEALINTHSALFRSKLPPGAYALKYPFPANGEYILYINGQLVDKRLGTPITAGILNIEPYLHEQENLIAFEINSSAFFPGLTAPLQVCCKAVSLAALETWDKLGLDWYSGRACYTCNVSIASKPQNAWIDLGLVEHYVEIWINGKHAGTRLWPPYKTDIGKFLKSGGNEITLIVSNSIANRFTWDQWTKSRTGESWNVAPKAEPSGLIGPCVIHMS